jgi:type VI secretion system secreted protein VgrG
VVTEEINPPFDPGTLEVFDYPGRYVKSSDGQKIAQAWRDMERSNDRHFHAEGSVVTCFPGALVTLKDETDSGFDGEYLALRSSHKFHGQAYRSGAGQQDPYEGRYELVKSDKTYAPPRLTRKAVINGPQTAKVVGEGDIDVDKYGRILVRFHWDQKEDQSRRCRVAQVWAGNEWGGIYTPRVGMEVVVTFLEGDPDHPLVIGCVYNDKHMPPYKLPGDKTISGVKSNSTTSGKGFNEFVFDDKDGSELVRLHAQKNLESVVEEDESRTVKNDRKTEIKQNDDLNVGQVLKVEAGTKIELICGGSKIVMTPEKIAIQALQVDIQATDFKTNALTSSHSAGALMSIQGTLVKIN